MSMRVRFYQGFVPTLLLFLSVSAHANAAVTDRAKALGLMPHHAVYELQLATKKSGSQVINISGQMSYEWQSSCDGWISNNKFDLRYEYADAPPVQIKSDFSTYESFDGKRYNFTSQRKSNGNLYEELRGTAEMKGEGKPSKAVFSIPEDLSFTLPEGLVFPMSHTIAVVDQLKAGKKFFSATTFDGSDQDGPIEINAFLGKPTTPPEKLALIKEIDQAMIGSKAWNIRLAFFLLNTSESASDYEMDMVFHENGLISDMLIDYGTFSVRQTLKEVKPLKDACETVKKKDTNNIREQ